MASQSYSGAPSRNQSKAAAIPSKVDVGHCGNTQVTAAKHGAAPHKAGPANQGFSGTGVISGKIKV